MSLSQLKPTACIQHQGLSLPALSWPICCSWAGPCGARPNRIFLKPGGPSFLMADSEARPTRTLPRCCEVRTSASRLGHAVLVLAPSTSANPGSRSPSAGLPAGRLTRRAEGLPTSPASGELLLPSFCLGGPPSASPAGRRLLSTLPFRVVPHRAHAPLLARSLDRPSRCCPPPLPSCR
jgi:hypothetical protein